MPLLRFRLGKLGLGRGRKFKDQKAESQGNTRSSGQGRLELWREGGGGVKIEKEKRVSRSRSRSRRDRGKERRVIMIWKSCGEQGKRWARALLNFVNELGGAICNHFYNNLYIYILNWEYFL